MRFENGYRALLASFAAAALVMASRGATARADQPGVNPPATGILQDQMGKDFQSSGLTLRGYAEAGYRVSWDHPQTGYMGYGQLFNDQSQDLTLDQVSLVLAKDVSRVHDRYAFGFIVQGIYGSDAQFTQANGTNFYGSHTASDYTSLGLPFVPTNGFPLAPPGITQTLYPLRNSAQPDPQNQLDVIQAAVTLAVPWGEGMQFTAGKFVTPWGLETIDPTMNGLYSHTYLYALGQPKTLTGVTATVRSSSDLSFMGGVVVGWDQSLRDNNDFPSGIGQVTYRVDPTWTMSVSTMFGPEQADNRSDIRWLVDFTTRCQLESDTMIGFEAMLANEPNVSSDYLGARNNPPTRFITVLGQTGHDATWSGAAAYLEQTFDEAGMFGAELRAEFFNDQNGGRGLATQVYSGTLGLKIVPFPNHDLGRGLIIRPEFRWDYAGDNVFDDNTKNAQISVGFDVIYSF